MTSKTSQLGAPAPRDSLEATAQGSKEDMKALAISGTDEPTNSSSAGSLQPPNKCEKVTKGPSEAASKPEVVRSSEASPSAPVNGDPVNGCNKEPANAAMITNGSRPTASIAELRRLARQPGSRIITSTLDCMGSLVDQHKSKVFASQNSFQILGKRLRKKDSGESYRELLDQTESLEEHFGHRVQTPQIFEKTLQLPPRLPGQATLINSVVVAAGTGTTRVQDPNQPAGQSAGNQASGTLASGKGLEKSALVGAAAKRPLLLTRDDPSLMDYDFGLCSNQIELQSKGVVSNTSCHPCLTHREFMLRGHGGKLPGVTRRLLVSEIKINLMVTSLFVANVCVENQTKCFENMLDLINLTYFGTQQSNALQPAQQTRLDAATSNVGGVIAANSVQPGRKDNTTQLPKADANGSSTLQQLGLGSVSSARVQHAGSGGTLSAPAANEGQKRMKLSQLDFLANPLRSDHPFEIWSAKEMALFSACICQFGKRFDLFVPLIKTKSEQEIYEFYRCWKYTKYYKTWKMKAKDRPKSNMASLNELVYHDRQI